ncbi:VOC family protein [Dactylosporangium sp. NPDC049525]|uniref:VOC family protein n=1 Tax=Dactylosporangium sp. NPDC049525 TaxID=3154730 RepID=UPI00343925A6
MLSTVEASVPVLYVSDVDRSVPFYALLGWSALRTGGDGTSRWCYLRCGELTMLLAAVQPRLITVELPLLVYFYVDNLEAALDALNAGGYAAERVGYPDHAPGGEGRVRDPDGNVILLGQRTAVAAENRKAATGAEARFSLIRQAAEAVSQRGGAPEHCQVGQSDRTRCEESAQVKLTDSWGDSAWACTTHTEEVLFNVRGAFIAVEDGEGLGQFLRGRTDRRPAHDNGN